MNRRGLIATLFAAGLAPALPKIPALARTEAPIILGVDPAVGESFSYTSTEWALGYAITYEELDEDLYADVRDRGDA